MLIKCKGSNLCAILTVLVNPILCSGKRYARTALIQILINLNLYSLVWIHVSGKHCLWCICRPLKHSNLVVVCSLCTFLYVTKYPVIYLFCCCIIIADKTLHWWNKSIPESVSIVCQCREVSWMVSFKNNRSPHKELRCKPCRIGTVFIHIVIIKAY